MSKAMTVSFIGSGNLAWHLAPALDNTDFPVREVYSRNPTHAEELVGRLYEADVKASLDFSTSNSSIFIIATRDEAIEEIVQEIVLPDDALLLHTSGSQPLSLLSYAATPNIGVFYPLQTFTKGKAIDFKEIPIFIESENEFARNILEHLAKAIGQQHYTVTSHERKALHVAAVFASNFANHMLLMAQQIMKDNDLSFDWLKPLIAETINKSITIGPENSQTGPARRADLQILDKHMEFLSDDLPLAELYKVISQHIVDTYNTLP